MHNRNRFVFLTSGCLIILGLSSLNTVTAQGVSRDVERKTEVQQPSKGVERKTEVQQPMKGVERKTEVRDTTDEQEGSKGLRPAEAGIKTNPKRRGSRPTTLRTPNRFTNKPAPRGTEYAQVGVTIWRVDSGQSKGVDQVGDEQTIERLDTNAPYKNGDTIRLRIQSPTGGYLYIVDREQYSDGTYGPAALVFPTTRTRGGNNQIEAWTPVEVPAYPAVWKFTPRKLKEGEARKVQTAEVLTLIISPKPLIDRSRISERQLALNKGEFESWLAQWQRPTQQFDVEVGVGDVSKSKGVEQDGGEASGEDEVGGQTTYQVAIKPGSSLLITLPLKFKTSP